MKFRPMLFLPVIGAGVAALSLIVIVAGCGGSSSPSPSPSPSLSPSASASPSPSPSPSVSPSPDVSPSPLPSPNPIFAPTVTLTADAQDLLRGQSTRLAWTSANATAVTESNFETTDLAGEKTVAPPQTTTYTLTVRNAGGQTAVSTVEVRVATVGVTVNPSAATVDVLSPLTLVAQVSGAVDAGVTWSVEETGGGSINEQGVYTAPATAGVYHVRATSNADTGKFAVAEVRVRAAGGSVTVN